MIFLFLLLHPTVPAGSFGEIGIYRHLFINVTAITANGDVYVLDRRDKILKRFDRNGKPLPNAAGPGQGPGQLVQPQKLQYQDKKLYVLDRHKALTFSESGAFLTQRPKPHDGLFFSKVRGGWLALRGLFPNQRHGPLQLVFYTNGVEGRVIHEWEPEQIRCPRKPENPSFIAFNPAEDHTTLVVSRNGRLAAVKPGGTADVYLFNIAHQTLIRKLTIKGPPLPFDKAHGETLFQTFKDRFSNMSVKIKADFPDFYPIIDGIHFSVNHHLVVKKWKGSTTTGTDHHQVFDATGASIHPRADDFWGGRIVGVHNGRSYITAFLSEDQGYTVRWLQTEEVGGFIMENPLPSLTHDSF